MSLVGPRPEVPRYVAHYPPALRERVLALRPGITDPASLAFIDEAALLAAAADPEREYIEVILPAKLQCSVDYAEQATPWSDLRVLLATLRRLAGHRPAGVEVPSSTGSVLRIVQFQNQSLKQYRTAHLPCSRAKPSSP